MDIVSNILVSGQYQAKVHTGHKFNDLGELIEEGSVLRESGKGKNLLLNSGFNFMGNNSYINITAVAGTGNTPVLPTDTTLASFRGYTTNLVSLTKTPNSTPDANGYVTWKLVYRFTFNPGSLGSTNINITEAGMATIGNPVSSTPLLSRGLLVDGSGNPTTVSLNAATEYLDLYWTVVFYIKAETTNTTTISVDGVDTIFSTTVRPVNFLNARTPASWMSMSGTGFPTFGGGLNSQPISAFGSCRALSGPLGALTGLPTGNYDNPSNASLAITLAYTNGNFYRDFTLRWLPTNGNVSGGVGAVTVLLSSSSDSGSGYFGFQVSYSPALPKISTKQLDLTYRFSIANMP